VHSPEASITLNVNDAVPTTSDDIPVNIPLAVTSKPKAARASAPAVSTEKVKGATPPLPFNTVKPGIPGGETLMEYVPKEVGTIPREQHGKGVGQIFRHSFF